MQTFGVLSYGDRIEYVGPDEHAPGPDWENPYEFRVTSVGGTLMLHTRFKGPKYLSPEHRANQPAYWAPVDVRDSRRVRVTYQPAEQDLVDGSMSFDALETIVVTVLRESDHRLVGVDEQGRDVAVPLGAKKSIRARRPDERGAFSVQLGYRRAVEPAEDPTEVEA